MGKKAGFPRRKKIKTATSFNKNLNNISHNVAVDAVLDNIDLLTQILTRVPPQPLFTLRTVSKLWLSIVSEPDFVVTQTHHHLTIHPPSSISSFHLYHFNTSTSLPKLDCIEISPLFKILSSCNGLILGQLSKEDPNYIVFNPTTKKHRLIHEPLGSLAHERAFRAVLAFDPLKSFNYKIVCFHFPMARIDIFSSESGAWKAIYFQDSGWDVVGDTRMIFWNGAIHWIASLNIHMSFIVDQEKITWDWLPTDPDTFPEKGVIGYFGNSDNGLLLIKFLSQETDEVFTLLEMDKDNCWYPKCQVDLRPLVSKYPDMNLDLGDGIKRFKYSVRHVKSGNKDGEFGVVLAIAEKFILYEVGKGNGDTDSKVLRELPFNIYGSYNDVHPFIGCLAPVL